MGANYRAVYLGINAQPWVRGLAEEPGGSANRSFPNTMGIWFRGAVAVADNTPPVITLSGINPATVEFGDAYNDVGATASYDVDGDVTANIATVNSVDPNTVGSYTVTYNGQQLLQ